MMSGTGAEGGEEHVEPQVDRSWADLKDAPLQFDPDFDLCGVCGDDEDVVQDEQGEGFIIPKGIPEPKAPPIENRGDTILLIGHTLRGVHIASWADA